MSICPWLKVLVAVVFTGAVCLMAPATLWANSAVENASYNSALSVFEQEDYAQAEMQAYTLIDELAAQGDTESELLGKTYRILAQTLFRRHRLPESKGFYQKAYDILSAQKGETDPLVLDIKKEMAFTDTAHAGSEHADLYQPSNTVEVTASPLSPSQPRQTPATYEMQPDASAINHAKNVTNTVNIKFPSQVWEGYQQAKQAKEHGDRTEEIRLLRLTLDKALALPQAKIKDYPHTVGMLRGILGTALTLDKRTDEAKKLLSLSVEDLAEKMPVENETLIKFRELLGFLYFQDEQYSEAQQQFATVVAHLDETDPGNWMSFNMLANCVYNQGDFAQAKELLITSLHLQRRADNMDPQTLNITQSKLDHIHQMLTSNDFNQDHYVALNKPISHWGKETDVIVVYIDPQPNIQGWQPGNVDLVFDAFKVWQTALNNKVRFIQSPSPHHVDVLVDWSNDPIHHVDANAVNERLGQHHLESWNGYYISSKITLALHTVKGDLLEADFLKRNAIHEVGHMLGLDHSSQPSDMMSALADYKVANHTAPALTQRDINSIRYLYQLRPNVTNIPGLRLTEYAQVQDGIKAGGQAINRQDTRQAYQIFKNLYYTTGGRNPLINYFYGVAASNVKHYAEAVSVLETLRLPDSNNSSVFPNLHLGRSYLGLSGDLMRGGPDDRRQGMTLYDLGIQKIRIAQQNPNTPPEQRTYLANLMRQAQSNRNRMLVSGQRRRFSIPLFLPLAILSLL